MNIVLMGPQGSGKGTQANILAERFGFLYFEAGSFLREIAKTNESLKQIMDSGQLVPDNEMASYVNAYLDSKNVYDQILFDGYPRDIKQYEILKSWLIDKNTKIDAVIVLEISEAETLKRLRLRKIKEGRGDDNIDSIIKRLKLYRIRTEKLISEIKDEVKIIEVNGERDIDAIAWELGNIVKNLQSETDAV